MKMPPWLCALLVPLALATSVSPSAAQDSESDGPAEDAAEAQAAEDEVDPDAQSAQEAMRGGGVTSDHELDDARAREHFQIATRYYDEGRFIEAGRQFEEAFELSGRTELQYNAYISYREAHQRRRAAAMLSSYLESVPNAPDRVNLEARLVELQRAIQQEEEQASQLTDAQRRAAAQTQRAEQEARARRAAEAAPEAWPWVILSVGGAAAIAGVVLDVLAFSEATALSGECLEDGRCPASVDLDGRRETAETMALVGDILAFGGGAVAVTGLILGIAYGLGGDPGEDPPSASVVCDGQGCYATVGGTF